MPHSYCEDTIFLDLGLATLLSGIQIEKGVPPDPASNAAVWLFTMRLGRYFCFKITEAAFLLRSNYIHAETL